MAQKAHDYARTMPSFSLADPTGKTFSFPPRSGRPTVVLISVPDMAQGSVQQDWANRLATLPSRVGFYLVEDMKNTLFRDMALSAMKKDYSEGDRPVVLIDSDGSVRKQFGVSKGKTCVLVYNRGNRLVYVQVGNATPAAVQSVRQKLAGL